MLVKVYEAYKRDKQESVIFKSKEFFENYDIWFEYDLCNECYLELKEEWIEELNKNGFIFSD